MSGTVLQFERKASPHTSAPAGLEPEVRTSSKLDVSETPATKGTPPFRLQTTGALATIPIEVLYPASEVVRPDLIKALGILADSIALLDRSRKALAARENLTALRELEKLKIFLPQLFALRSIGDGFAAIVNAIEIALVNKRGAPLDERQLSTVWRVLRELRSKPFISLDAAQDQVEELENSGLQVDPSIFGEIFDDFEDESIR